MTAIYSSGDYIKASQLYSITLKYIKISFTILCTLYLRGAECQWIMPVNGHIILYIHYGDLERQRDRAHQTSLNNDHAPLFYPERGWMGSYYPVLSQTELAAGDIGCFLIEIRFPFSPINYSHNELVSMRTLQ